MKDQFALLRHTSWDVLIVLDACRADFFAETAGAEAPGLPSADGEPRACRSPAPCTKLWVRRVGPWLARQGVLYFSANPVVEREAEAAGLDLRTVSIWRDLWGHFTDERIPSVHPWAVNGTVLAHREAGRLEERRVVVHYLQPHSPYIGRTPLKMARWGPAENGLGRACHRLRRPDHLAGRGDLSWGVVRRAYRDNLRLARRAALHLAGRLGGRVVLTADHGEVLGEHGGKFGHECHWDFEELRRVPWLELSPAGEGTTVEQKLEALGYLS